MGIQQSKPLQSVLLLVGAGAVVTFGYRFYSKQKLDSNETQKSTQNYIQHQKNKSSVENNPLLNSGITKSQENLLKTLMTQIKVQYTSNQNMLSMPTIMSILEYSPELAEEQFTGLTQRNRIERREARKTNPKLYQKLVMDYNEEIENILEQAQFRLLDALKITKEVFEESIICLMERGFFQQFFMIQAAIRQRIKEKIQTTKQVPLSVTKDIIKYQVQFLESKPKEFELLIQKLKSDPEKSPLIPLTINTMLQDIIHSKFGIEEEDQIKNMTDPALINDSEIQTLLIKIEQAMMELMGPVEGGFGDEFNS